MPDTEPKDVLPYRTLVSEDPRPAPPPIYLSEGTSGMVWVGAVLTLLAAGVSLLIAFNDPFWSTGRHVIVAVWSLGPPLFLLIDSFWLFDNAADAVARARHRAMQAAITRLWAGLLVLLTYAYLFAYLRRIARG